MNQVPKQVVNGQVDADLGREAEARAGDQFRQLFNELGAPDPGVGGEKPQVLFTAPSQATSAQVAEAVRSAPTGCEATEHESAGRESAERRGRKPAITPQIADRIVTLLSVGFSRRQAADFVEIDHTTITRTAARDDQFARALHTAEAMARIRRSRGEVANSGGSRAPAQHSTRKPSQAKTRTINQELQDAEAMLADERRRAERLKNWVGLRETGPLSKKELDEYYVRLNREAGPPLPRRWKRRS